MRTKWRSLFRMNAISSNQGFAIQSPVVQKLCVIRVCTFIHATNQAPYKKDVSGDEQCPFNGYQGNHLPLFNWMFTNILYEIKNARQTCCTF